MGARVKPKPKRVTATGEPSAARPGAVVPTPPVAAMLGHARRWHAIRWGKARDPQSMVDAGTHPPRAAVPARRDLGRLRCQLRPLLRERASRRALPVRRWPRDARARD